MADEESPPSHTVVPIGTVMLITESFDHSRVTGLRHDVASCAGKAGLRGQRLDDFVLAVNELLTNAIRHGGGQGRISLWHEGCNVVCEVSDTGSGLSTDRLDNQRRPRLDTPGGWGLWLAGQLTDAMHIDTGADGTSVRISSAAEPSPTGTPEDAD